MKRVLPKSILIVAARIFVGAIFVYAGVGKVLDPAGFAEQVANYRLVPGLVVVSTAVVMPWAELLAGTLLIVGRAVRPAALVCFFLEILFLLAVSSALLRGLNIECGCFAGAHALVSFGHLVEDLILLALTIWVYFRA